MNAAEREKLNTEAMISPAPQLPGLELRPFNDGALALCAQLGLSLFTLDAMMTAASADGEPGTRSAEVIGALGFAEVNRQCHFLFFILGHPDIEQMMRLVQEPDAYQRHVMPWLLRQRYDGSLVPRMLGEWSRFMRHFIAASVDLVPREGDSDPRAPGN